MTSEELSDFLTTARKQYDFGKQADAEDRAAAEDDNRFAYADDRNLDQWPKAAKSARKKRPVLQWNRIPTYVQQVTNDGRQNKPAIKISPGDDAATKQTAEFFTARIRQIEYESNASTAKDAARDQQVVTGRGAIRVGTEWIPGTQRQRICIDRIENQFSVVWDPSARKYDRSDADWCFLISQISKDEHTRRFGEKTTLQQMAFASNDPELDNWIGVGDSGEMIQIAEYWLKEWTTRDVPAADGQPARTEKVAKIKQYIINGVEILEETDWLGSTIPVVPFWGKEAIVDGKLRTFSLIRNAKEPQRLANLFLSNMAEQIGQMPKSPYLVPVNGIAGNHEGDWQNALNTPLAYLYYQSFDAQGRPLPRPERVVQEPPIQALVEGLNHCFDGIKASMGIFDASLGAKSNETSGIAIQRRQKEADVSNYHFPSNEERSNKYLGEILVELIPLLDRPGSKVPIRSEDGKTHVVPIGEAHEDWKTGETVTHDLMSGQYGVYVSSGPSYDSMRQEAYDRDAAMVQAQPELMFVIGDQMFANDDTAGAEERADRLKRYISMKTPGLIEQPGQGEQIPQEVQAKMQQMGQELQQTQAFAQSLHEQIQTEQVKSQLQVRLKQMDLDFQREKLAVDDQNAKLKVASVEGIAELQSQIDVLMHRDKLNHSAATLAATQQHADATQGAQQAHEQGMQQTSQQAAADQQENAQQHAAEQSDADRQAAAQAQAQQPEGAE